MEYWDPVAKEVRTIESDLIKAMEKMEFERNNPVEIQKILDQQHDEQMKSFEKLSTDDKLNVIYDLLLRLMTRGV